MLVTGHANVVILHPSSVFHEESSQLDWAIFHQVVWTSHVGLPVPVVG
jgi:hypothetical protein